MAMQMVEEPKNMQLLHDAAVDPRDIDTPDNWVKRHPKLVRLTGMHPFNVEAPLDLLYDQGFLTPASLHYVRNHGPVPQLDWSTHKVQINGLVSEPLTFSMDELAALPSMSIPVTLTCAGNRRKEQNMTKQTIGFSWGAAATSCGIWTGVRLRDVLELAGYDKSKARHVCFVGEGELPKGNYGTSIDINTACDPAGDVMLAYEYNGEKLHPDHGYPVRVLIPGWIGGRMVKWVREITVTEKPSENHYHFFDNRILPPHVDGKKAEAEGWWFKPEYLFNELNINSAISYPKNEEVLELSECETYDVQGYAYSGGGRKITRVEISLDCGYTWEFTELRHPEMEYSYAPATNNKWWCWCFFKFPVPVQRLAEALEIRCRAWDEGNNGQPATITWNLMGMGNNPHFRVEIHQTTTPKGNALIFRHPTTPGPSFDEAGKGNSGGWMGVPDNKKASIGSTVGVREMAGGIPYTVEEVAVKETTAEEPAKSNGVTYTMSEVEKHNTQEDCWIVVKGRVIDASTFIQDHPGGVAALKMKAGKDATEEFSAIHSAGAWKLLDKFYIGDLAQPKL